MNHYPSGSWFGEGACFFFQAVDPEPGRSSDHLVGPYEILDARLSVASN